MKKRARPATRPLVSAPHQVADLGREREPLRSQGAEKSAWRAFRASDGSGIVASPPSASMRLFGASMPFSSGIYADFAGIVTDFSGIDAIFFRH
jgi:hypothetical protein